MEVKIVNEGILDEKEPTIYVQRYIYPQRTYQVHRKPMSEDEEFILSDDADNTEHRLWCISTLLTEPYEPDDEFFEIVADIYLDEENPPVVNPEECSNADPYGHVVYDAEMHLYCWEATFVGYDDLETVAASTLQEAIEKGIAILDNLIEAKL